MRLTRRPPVYLGVLVTTVALGLATRGYPSLFPLVVARYGGDALWAAMVMWVAALLRPAARTWTLALLAYSVAVAVEVSQLYHAPWIDAVRATRIGALALGQGFLWSDLASYAGGTGLAAAVDAWLVRRRAARAGMSERVTVDLLKELLAAFNRHDLDAIMEYFADECVFYMPRGAGPRGDRYIGKADVRAGLAKRFEGIPDVHYGDDTHWVGRELGVSEWTLTGTSVKGERIRVRGVDLLEFAEGKIIRKDSFWKILQ